MERSIGCEDGILVFFRVGFDAPALDVLQVHDEGELLGVDALFIIDVSVGIGNRDDLAAQLKDFFDGVLGHVAASGDEAGFAFQGLVAGGQHFCGKVNAAVSGCFRPDERSAPVQALAGENAGELIAQSLVLAEHISDFSAADTDVACRNVGVRTDVPAKLRHEALAEIA